MYPAGRGFGVATGHKSGFRATPAATVLVHPKSLWRGVYALALGATAGLADLGGRCVGFGVMNILHGMVFHKKAVMPNTSRIVPANPNTPAANCVARESLNTHTSAMIRNRNPVAVMRLLLHVHGYA